jgi:AcrR family transcriptional regulator
MARRSDHSRDEIRDMAIAAAEQIVVAEGYAGLSARKVAAAIGYTVGTLYLVFRNLDDLVLQVNARTLERLHAKMVAVRDQAGDPAASLLRLGEAYIGFAAEDPHRWGMVFEHRGDGGTQLPDWYRDKATRMFELVEDLLSPLAPERDAKEIARAARAIWGGVHGICILAVTGKLDVAGVDSVQELSDTLIRHFLAGFVRPPIPG